MVPWSVAGNHTGNAWLLGLDKNVRSGYQQIRVSVKIKSDLTEAQKDDLVKTAQKYSPVFDIVSNGVPVVVGAEHT